MNANLRTKFTQIAPLIYINGKLQINMDGNNKLLKEHQDFLHSIH